MDKKALTLTLDRIMKKVEEDVNTRGYDRLPETLAMMAASIYALAQTLKTLINEQ